MSRDQWIWQPHPGHFICADRCKFFLNTYVNGYIISTVGEYLPPAAVRLMLAKARGIELREEDDYIVKVGYENIGCDRKYETMVFEAQHIPDQCCEWRQQTGENIDFCGYNDPISATKGHYLMCEKYNSKEIKYEYY